MVYKKMAKKIYKMIINQLTIWKLEIESKIDVNYHNELIQKSKQS